MSFKFFAVGAIAALAVAGCGKDSPAGRLGDEVDKQATEAQLRGGDWYQVRCNSTGLIWQAVGIQSSREVYDFDGDAEYRLQYFSDAGCANLVGQATYAGTADVGTRTSFDNDARIIDMNFLTLSVVITDQATVDSLNGALTPSCGINDWKINEARPIPNDQAGTLNCPFVSKPAPKFDVLKTDGRTLHFGDVSGANNATTQDLRPQSLDMANGFEKR